MIKLFNAAEGGGLSGGDVEVSLDGIRYTVSAGEVLRLKPGESITLTPYLYHEFWTEPGSGTSIVQEVSTVNDDDIDNNFYEAAGRFPEIEEDTKPAYLLCTEYQ